MLVTVSALTAILLLVTLIPCSRREAYWIRGLDFPRLQFFVLALLILVLQLTCLDFSSIWPQLLLASCLGCLLVQGWWIMPYTPCFPREVLAAPNSFPAHSLSIMNANVLMSNHNTQGLLDLVEENDPDLLITLESDGWWQQQLACLEQKYPYTVKCPLDNLYGMHVYSRLRLLETQLRFLVEKDIPSVKTLIELRDGTLVQGFFVHPKPPSPTENPMSSERDAELVLVAREAAGCERPVVVSGDLNDVAWSQTTRLFRKISGLLDPRVGRGMFNTFHAWIWFLRWPLDHIFHSDHFTLSDMRVLRGYGSDHFAIISKLVCDGNHRDEQDGPDADQDDRQWASHKAANPHDDGY